MNVLNEILQGLEWAFQKHEKEFVVELASDRILHQIGVYLILVLAVISKSSEIVGGNLSCYYADNTSYDKVFLAFANSYCWESSPTKYNSLLHPMNGTCQKYTNDSQIFLKHPDPIKSFVQWMPYLFLFEVALFALPSLFWHNIVGGRVTGHLQFVKSFLHDVYEKYGNIPAGMYRKKAYDKKSNYLDGWRPFRKNYKTKHQQGMRSGQFVSGQNKQSGNKNEKAIYNIDVNQRSLENVISAITNELQEEEDNIKDEPARSDENNVHQVSIWSRFLSGDFRDRHLFSMLCYENFASLEYHPYIMSIYALTSTGAAEKDKKGVHTMQQGILRQFCHKDNFSGNFLIRCYSFKCVLRITLAFSMLATLSIVFNQTIIPSISTKTFLCEISFHDVCMVCTIKKHWDVMGIFIVNFCIVLAYFCLSLFQFYFVRFGSNRALCYYLEDIMDSFSVAGLSAHKANS